MKKVVLSLVLSMIPLNHEILTTVDSTSLEDYPLYEDVDESDYGIDLLYWEVLPE